jgi:predicted ABC-type ATPase
MTRSPLVVILAGPNGAGKSTVASSLLQGAFEVDEFVNADTLASGLSAFRPETVAPAAGRLMLSRLEALARQRADFAFETTLAARTYVPWLRTLRADGYRVHIVFLALPDAESAVLRVTERVARGGHDIPPDVVRRRYAAGLCNFHELYRSLASSWRLYDNSHRAGPILVAEQRYDGALVILAADTWARMGGDR